MPHVRGVGTADEAWLKEWFSVQYEKWIFNFMEEKFWFPPLKASPVVVRRPNNAYFMHESVLMMHPGSQGFTEFRIALLFANGSLQNIISIIDTIRCESDRKEVEQFFSETSANIGYIH